MRVSLSPRTTLLSTLCALALARTSALVALQVDRDGLREVVAEVANVFLCECLPCDDYTMSVYHVWDYK